MTDGAEAADAPTAKRFAHSWNDLPTGSVYTSEQFEEWLEPLSASDLEGRSVVELGFGNGSLLVHVARCQPRRLAGVELGDTLETALSNLGDVADGVVDLHRGDLTRADLGQFDVAYCIGVLHHLDDPEAGFGAVLRHTLPGGRFHCWVYGHEGNLLVRWLVEPIRMVASRLPWRFTKYAIALPLSVPFYLYAKMIRAWEGLGIGKLGFLPLAAYCRWIARRSFPFFHHVAFDQLVTPRTVYLRKSTLESWLSHPDVEPASRYLIFRNGNSWKFGGRRRDDSQRDAALD